MIKNVLIIAYIEKGFQGIGFLVWFVPQRRMQVLTASYVIIPLHLYSFRVDRILEELLGCMILNYATEKVMSSYYLLIDHQDLW